MSYKWRKSASQPGSFTTGYGKSSCVADVYKQSRKRGFEWRSSCFSPASADGYRKSVCDRSGHAATAATAKRAAGGALLRCRKATGLSGMRRRRRK